MDASDVLAKSLRSMNSTVSAAGLFENTTAQGLKSTKQMRIKQLQNDDDVEVPESYLTNSNKELLCLEYVKNFRTKFHECYPNKKDLYLTARNEFNVEKFLCTTIRPTQLPFKEVYELEDCAEFVARFLHYEPLENPTAPPSCLPSSTQVLKWGVGDSFDFAVLLTSYLIGAGYDAYLVLGTAPKWVTHRDESRQRCPLLAAAAAAKDEEGGGGGDGDGAKAEGKDEKDATLGGGGNQTSPSAAGRALLSARSGASGGAKGGAGGDEDGVGWAKADDGSKGGGEGDGDEDGGAADGAGGGGADEDGAAGMGDPAAVAEAKLGQAAQRYVPKVRGVAPSKFLAAKEAERLAAASKADPQWESDDDEDAAKELAEARAGDELAEQRCHAWALVRGGKRALEEMLFVEPTTGRTYPVARSPYRSVAALCNAKNYYVNVQPEDLPLSSVQYDVLNNDCWEYVLIDPQRHGLRYSEGDDPLDAKDATGALGADITGGLRSMNATFNGTARSLGGAMNATAASQGGADDGASGGPGDLEDENVLDMPPSWVAKLVIDRDLFLLRYPPDGQRTVFYRRAKLELFAETIHDTCLAKRLTLYKDARLTVAKEVREYFTHRLDLLHTRSRFPLEGRTVEDFHPGRPNALCRHTEWTGRRRELTFYVEARDDGLVSRTDEFGRKVTERFEGRGDRLVYRSVTFWDEGGGGGGGGGVAGPGAGNNALEQGGPRLEDKRVRKMTQKYDRDPGTPADQDVAKRKYYLSEGLVRSVHHRRPRAVTARATLFQKERAARPPQLYAQDEPVPPEEREAYVAAEKQCLKDLKELSNEVAKLLTKRRAEEKRVERAPPLAERARARRAQRDAAGRAGGQGGGDGAGGDDPARGLVDYLTPFLQNVQDPRSLTQQEALRARDACLKALKDRLIERANIIQTKLNAENAELSKKQATFERNQRDSSEAAEEDFQREMHERVFRIQILERRLQQHEEAALKKYADMDEKLAKDPRLAVLADK